MRSKHKHWHDVLEYCESIRDGRKIACMETKQAVERFYRDLENPEYELVHKAPEFCISIIESTIKHQQGKRLTESRSVVNRFCSCLFTNS